MDIERAQELQQSLMWAGVVEELDRKIHFEIKKLRTCSPEELIKIQFSVACYESLKQLPQDIIDRESQ